MHLIIIGISYHIYTHISATRCKRSLVTQQNVLNLQWGYLNWVLLQKLGIGFKFTDVDLLGQFFRRYSLFQVKPTITTTTMPHCDSPHWFWTNNTLTPTTSTCKTLLECLPNLFKPAKLTPTSLWLFKSESPVDTSFKIGASWAAQPQITTLNRFSNSTFRKSVNQTFFKSEVR